MDQTPTRLSWTESRWVLNSPSLWHLTFSSPLSSLSKTEGDSDIEWGCLWHSNVPCAINGFTNSCVLQDMYKLYFYNHLSLYIYIILYIDTCLSLSLYSLLYLWRSPSLTKPLRFGLFGWRPWPVPWHPPRAAGPLQGLRGLAAFRATQHVTTYINTSIHIAIEGVWAASTLPVAKGPWCSFSNSLYLRVLEPALVRTVNQYIGMPEHIEADTKTTGPHWCTQHPAQLPCPQRATYWIGFPRLWIEYGACAGALKRCCSSFDQFLRIACSR